MAYSKGKKKGQAQLNELGIDPRNLSAEQRRELFTKAKKDKAKNDWRVLQSNQVQEIVPSNLLPWDFGLRLYGLARRGTVYHIHGDEEAGKSTTTYALNREYQRATGEPVAIFDFEGTTQSWYLRSMGVDEDMAFVKFPSSIDDAMKDAIDLLSQGVRMFTFDSIPRMRNMVDVALIKSGEAFKIQPGTHARQIEQFYSMFLPHLIQADGTVLMVNQIRARLEMTRQAQLANSGKDTVLNLRYNLPGGKANRFNSSVMLELSKQKAWRPGKHEDEFLLEPETQNGEPYVAVEVKGRTIKNKSTGTGYREAPFWIRPGRGLDELISVRQYAREMDLIAFQGRKWYVGENMDEAIVVYDNKSDAIKDLVIRPNIEVHERLKGLIVKRFEEDPSLGQIELDDESKKYVSGEVDFESDDDNAVPSLKPQAVDDDDL